MAPRLGRGRHNRPAVFRMDALCMHYANRQTHWPNLGQVTMVLAATGPRVQRRKLTARVHIGFDADAPPSTMAMPWSPTPPGALAWFSRAGVGTRRYQAPRGYQVKLGSSIIGLLDPSAEPNLGASTAGARESCWWAHPSSRQQGQQCRPRSCVCVCVCAYVYVCVRHRPQC